MNLFQRICFQFAFSWFSLPRHWSNKDTASCKQEIFSKGHFWGNSVELSKDSLLFNASDAVLVIPQLLLLLAKFSIRGEKGETRKPLISFLFLLLLFIFPNFPRLYVLNQILFNLAKSWFDNIYYFRQLSQPFIFSVSGIIIIIYCKNTATVK